MPKVLCRMCIGRGFQYDWNLKKPDAKKDKVKCPSSHCQGGLWTVKKVEQYDKDAVIWQREFKAMSNIDLLTWIKDNPMTGCSYCMSASDDLTRRDIAQLVMQDRLIAVGFLP